MDYHYLPNGQPLSINTGAVKPFECLSGGWRLVKDQYGLFLGMCLVIILLVTVMPFTGLIWGAWNAGIYLALLERMRGERTSFGAVTKGFQFFRPAFTVEILAGLPLGLIGAGAKLWVEQLTPAPNVPASPEAARQTLMILFGLVLLYVIVHLVMNVIFAFAYPLVVEQKLSGWQAIKVSFHGARRNLGGICGLVLLNFALSVVGALLCLIGLAFTMPITTAAWAMAYRQAFPEPAPADPIYVPPPAYANQPLQSTLPVGNARSGGPSFAIFGLVVGFALVLLIAAGGGLFVYLKYQSSLATTQVAQKKLKKGFIDKTGKVVITPSFDEAYSFSDNLAPVEIADKWGYIDKTGAFIIAPQFDKASIFSEGLAVAKSGDKWGFIDKSGKFIIGPSFDQAVVFAQGLAAVKSGSKWGFIDKTGKLVINFRFDDALAFANGLAGVKENGKWGYINRIGKYIIALEFDDADSFADDFAPVEEGEKWFFIDEGRIEMYRGDSEDIGKYLDASAFSEGLAAVKSNYQWGYIDNSGKFKILPQFDRAFSFHEGLAAVVRKGKSGFIDQTGALVIDLQFDGPSHFSEGLAPVAIIPKD